MEDWLPSERSTPPAKNFVDPGSTKGAADRLRRTETHAEPGSTRQAVDRLRRAENSTARGGVATEEATDGTRQRFTEALTARARSMTGTRPVGTRPTRRLIRRDIMIRRIDPWSVLKISLVFYTCMLIIAMLANAVLWAFISRLGLIDQVTEVAAEALNIAVRINTGNILRAFFLLGVLGVIFWSAVNVFLAYLYNLVADLIGGIRVDLAEDE